MKHETTALVWTTFRKGLPPLAARTLVQTLWVHPSALTPGIPISVKLPLHLACKVREGQHAPVLAYAKATKAYFDAVLRDTTQGLNSLECCQYRLAIKLVIDAREESRGHSVRTVAVDHDTKRVPRHTYRGPAMAHGGIGATDKPPLVGETPYEPRDIAGTKCLLTHRQPRQCNTDLNTYQRQHAPKGYRWDAKRARYVRKRRR